MHGTSGDREGGIVAIIGEPGVGKTRLLAEARHRLAMRGLLWMEGHTLSFGEMISYWPFLEMLRRYAGIGEDDSEGESWSKLERRLSEVFGEEAPDVAPYLATLLATEVPAELAERVKYVDGEAMHRQLFRAARRLFEQLASHRPLVLVLEDVHWMDQSSAELLEHLLPLVRDVPILVCGISRPERHSSTLRLREVATQQYADRYTEITIRPLAPSDSDELLAHLLVIDERSASMRELIRRKAEGNPFYVEEVVRSLVQQGTIVWDENAGRWRINTRLEQVNIPDTVHGVIVARLDRLDGDVKEVLRLASIVGRSFLYRVLRAIDTTTTTELDRCLSELQEFELIRERGRTPELEYMFSHALTQEATYESILIARRRELHQRVAACIEVVFGDRLECSTACWRTTMPAPRTGRRPRITCSKLVTRRAGWRPMPRR